MSETKKKWVVVKGMLDEPIYDTQEAALEAAKEVRYSDTKKDCFLIVAHVTHYIQHTLEPKVKIVKM